MKALPAVVVDVLAILIFAILGRSSHAEANTLLGVLGTAWPFLAGALFGHALGWLVAPPRPSTTRGADPTYWRTGLAVWASTLVLGMLLRVASGATAAWSFVVVAGIVLAAFLLGWRGLFRLVQRARAGTDAPV